MERLKRNTIYSPRFDKEKEMSGICFLVSKNEENVEGEEPKLMIISTDLEYMFQLKVDLLNFPFLQT